MPAMATINTRKLATCLLGVLVWFFCLSAYPAQGTEPANISFLVNVTTANELSTLDSRTRLITSTADITITNISQQTVLAPLHAVFIISTTGVLMPDALGGPSTTPYDKYYYDLGSKLSAGKLAPQEKVTFTAKFVRSSTIRFTYSVLTYGIVQTGNQPPVANAGQSRTETIPYGKESMAVTLDGSSSTDPDGSITSYAWSGTPQPANLSRPIVTLAEGQHTFSLIVTDSNNATSQPASVTITVVREVVRLPQITVATAPPFRISTGADSPLIIAVNATSPDARPVTLSAAPFITNASFSSTTGLQATGTFGLKPDYGQQGNYLITFTARDSYGLTAEQTILIEVARTNLPPELALQSTATVDEGKQLLIPVIANDPDGDNVILSAAGLPVNALFIPASRTISFIPGSEQAGSYHVTVSATDSYSTVQKNVTITVNDVPPGSGTTPLTLTVDPAESPNFLATQRITGRVNSSAPAQPAQKTALITGLDPAGGEQGATLSVILTGDAGAYATHFATGSSALSFGDGITINKFTVTGPTAATAEILITPAASIGIRQVTITTGSETALSVNAFNVLKGKSSVTGRLIDPATGQAIAGATIVIQGTNISAITGVDGSFSIEGAPVGEQNLIVTSANHEVLVVQVNTQPNTTITINDLKPASTVFDASAPPSVSLGSIMGRGITGFTPLTDKTGLKKLLTDAVLLVGGSELGILDEYGNQVNPEVSDGLLNIKAQGVDRLADSMMRGETFSLAELLFSFSQSIPWGGSGIPLTLQQWLESLQEMVNLAWNDPMNQENAMTVLIFNNGRNLLPDPPKLSPATRLNHLQAFLFTNSLFAYMKAP